MRWQSERRSTNVEDRRGISVRGGAIGGGAVIVALIAALLGAPPGVVRSILGGGEEVQEGTQPIDPADNERVDFVTAILGSTEDVWTAVLPGTGPMKDEFVVVGAHYDHLGRGGSGSLKPGSNEIHNGADDNASGTSAMLKLAEVFSKQGSMGRSILFCAFTAEESGLIGSQHLVSHPPVPLEKMAYMVNLDMVGRVRGEVIYVGGMGTAPSFDKILADADEASPLQMKSASGRSTPDRIHDHVSGPRVERASNPTISSPDRIVMRRSLRIIGPSRISFSRSYGGSPVDTSVAAACPRRGGPGLASGRSRRSARTSIRRNERAMLIRHSSADFA